MPRSPLPQDYIFKEGTLFENFETAVSWTKSGSDPIGTVTNDTINVRSGSSALRITINTPGSNVSATKAINQRFSNSTIFHIWAYMPEWVPGSNCAHLEVTLSSYTNWTQLFRKSFTSGIRSFVPGWNHLTIHASEFTNQYGGEDWARPMLRLQFRVYCATGGAGYLTLDSFSYAQESFPVCTIGFDGTFDTVYTNAFAKMNPLGLRATVYLTKDVITSGVGACGAALTIPHIDEMYEAGWTIGNHTVTHPNLSTLSQAQVEDEIMGCHEWMESMGWVRGIKHLANPFGTSFSAEMIAACEATSLHTSRGTFASLDPVPVGSMYELRSKQLGESTTLATVKGWLDEAIRNQATLNLFGHSIADGHEADPNFWGSTKFNNLIDYIIARKIPCVTIDEWFQGLTNSRYTAASLTRPSAVSRSVVTGRVAV